MAKNPILPYVLRISTALRIKHKLLLYGNLSDQEMSFLLTKINQCQSNSMFWALRTQVLKALKEKPFQTYSGNRFLGQYIS